MNRFLGYNGSNQVNVVRLSSLQPLGRFVCVRSKRFPFRLPPLEVFDPVAEGSRLGRREGGHRVPRPSQAAQGHSVAPG